MIVNKTLHIKAKIKSVEKYKPQPIINMVQSQQDIEFVNIVNDNFWELTKGVVNG